MSEYLPAERESVKAALSDLSKLAAAMAEPAGPLVARAAGLIAESLRADGKVLACGNGGSAADAEHFVCELLGRLGRERRSLPAVSLCGNSSAVSAIANDYGYTELFSRQVEGLGRPGDVLIGITTSGKSANVIKAIQTASARRLRTIALVGETPSPALEQCDVCIRVPSRNTQRVQEIHMALLHAICAEAEQAFL